MLHSFQLPVGARITSLRAALYDEEGDKELKLILSRQANQFNGTSGIGLASVNTTGISTTYQDLTDDSIGTIDGANIARENDVYVLTLKAVQASDVYQSTSWSSIKLRMAQVSVDYVVE